MFHNYQIEKIYKVDLKSQKSKSPTFTKLY